MIMESDGSFLILKLTSNVFARRYSKVSVESVNENLVLKYEHQYNQSRQLCKNNVLEEMSIAENRPELQQADALLNRVINNY